MKAAVIGSPISHSLSPLIFSFISKKEMFQLNYQAKEVNEKETSEFFEEIKNQDNFLGCNVTLPLKEIFIDKLDFTSPEVAALGALNVLHVKQQQVHGYNTDIIGIKKTFEAAKFSIKNKSCLLLGAGGSAKAIAYVLGNEGAANVIIFNRSERSHDLVAKFQKLFPNTNWKSVNSINDVQAKLDLIINTTPLGMTGKDPGRDFFQSLKSLSFNSPALGFDLIYTPEHTEFLKLCESLGLTTVGGLGMLIDQALATWKIWIGPLKNENRLHEELHNFLTGILWLRQNDSAIYLTGFMGVGKSTVGTELASILKRDFIDTDALIQKAAGLSIPEIFSKKGESYFREVEHSQINSLSKNSKNSIVSLGGGALMNPLSLSEVKKSGMLIYLSADARNILERINTQKEERPLLANLSTDKQLIKITELLAARKNVYEQAMVEINTDKKDVSDICFAIISAIGIWQQKDNS